MDRFRSARSGSARSSDAMIDARKTLCALSLVLAGAALAVDAVAPTGSIAFEAKNVFSTAHGTFKSWRVVRAEIDSAAPEQGVVEVEVDVASLETGIERRDDHLRTADF